MVAEDRAIGAGRWRCDVTPEQWFALNAQAAVDRFTRATTGQREPRPTIRELILLDHIVKLTKRTAGVRDRQEAARAQTTLDAWLSALNCDTE